MEIRTVAGRGLGGTKRVVLWSFPAIFLFSVLLLSTARVYAAQVTLAWDPSSDSGTVGYKLHYGTKSGTYDSSIDVGNTTQYTITNLNPNTTYYFAATAYDANNNESAFSNEVVATTAAAAPTVTTIAPSSITSSSALSGGSVTSDGGSSLTAEGVCWSTSVNPTLSGSCTTDGNATGNFNSSITGLSANTLYHIRAYATNSVGTTYGDEITFNTTAAPPTVTTMAVSSITSTGASSGGNVSTDGGSAVTARGVCWSTSATPSISDNCTTEGSGTGSFTSSITGLAANTAYYVRAYATNSTGTTYGSDLMFNTTSQNGGGTPDPTPPPGWNSPGGTVPAKHKRINIQAILSILLE